jgi:hypothetical protein
MAGTSALAIASGLITTAAPAAHAATTLVGSCQGFVALGKVTTAVKGVGLGDQTNFIKVSGNLAKDQTNNTAIPGNCDGITRPGDPHIPYTGGLNALTPKSAAISLGGNVSCALGATAQAADATAAAKYPLNGKVTWTFAQMYTDLITAAPKAYKMQLDITVLGIGEHGNGLDVIELGGIVLSGVNAGATLTTYATDPNFASSVWRDPVVKTGNPSGYNTGYEADLGPAVLGCTDGTAGNANITQVLIGGGTSSATSLIGSSAKGFHFEFGQP